MLAIILFWKKVSLITYVCLLDVFALLRATDSKQQKERKERENLFTSLGSGHAARFADGAHLSK